MTTPNLVFLDTETTGLDRRRHDVWDIGLILRQPEQPDQEHQWFVRPNLRRADPNGLRIGRYYDRMTVPGEHGARYTYTSVGATAGPEPIDEWTAAELVTAILDGSVVLGIVPDFDAHMIGKWLRRHNHAWTAHYQLVDVEALAAGALKLPPPWSTDEILSKFGLRFDEADRHTAIGDARMARDLYDRVMARETVFEFSRGFDYDHYGPAGASSVTAQSWAGSAVDSLTAEVGAGGDPTRFEQGLTDPAPTVPTVHHWSVCSHGVDYASEAEHDRECPALALSPSWEVPR